jgi:hypothetical protein
VSDQTPADLDGHVSRVLEWIRSSGHDEWWLKPEISALFERSGYYLVPHHFYAPVPSPSDIAAASFDEEKYPFGPTGFVPDRCQERLKSLALYWEEFAEFVQSAESADTFRLANPFYSGMDAFILFATVRSLRPMKVIEIGSGYSTHITASAMQRNNAGSITCIEPYPTPKLKELSDVVNIIEARVQDVDPSIFQSLEAQDICFIDSSHVSRLDSDVNWLLFRVLPTLKPGVAVHLHDIFLPYEYPRLWVKDRRWFWNEQYLLYGYLLGDSGRSLEISMPVHAAARLFRDQTAGWEERLDGFSADGCAFWLTVH